MAQQNCIYCVSQYGHIPQLSFKGMEHVPNIFMSFDKYLVLEVINILIYIDLFKQYEIQLFKKYLNPI